MALKVDFLAGALGGCAGVFAGHPFDTVKVQIQTQEHGGKYMNLADCIKMLRNQKLSKGFFRGMSGPLLSYSYLNAIYFGCYGWLLKQLNYQDEPFVKRPNYSVIATASMLSAVPQTLFSCPVEVIKVVLQSQIRQRQVDAPQSGNLFKGPVETAVNIMKTKGIRGLYRGLPTQMVRDVPSMGLYMTVYRGVQYEGTKQFFSSPNYFITFVAGGMAGVACWTSILPIDVVKSKIQADHTQTKYKGFWDCAKKIYHAGGPRAFFTGFIPLSVRAFLVNAVILMVYSESLKALKKL